MILYMLFSFVIGLEGGMFDLRGDNIVSSSFGPSFGVFGDLSVTPNLSYSLSFTSGRAEASSNFVTLDTLTMQRVPEVAGEDFQYLKANLSVSWCPFQASFFPYLSGRLGLNQWKLLDANGDVAEILNGNDCQGLSLSIGGGAGIKAAIAGFVVSAEAFSDFIFSENNDFEKGFGVADHNEWTVEGVFRLGKEF